MAGNKSSGFDNVSTQHLLFGGDELCVHLCLLFNTMLQHCYVPDRLGYGLIVPLLKDKHGNQSRSEMYRGITLSPTIAKLFEYLSMKLYGDQLLSDPLQLGFKKYSGCCHAKKLPSILLRKAVTCIVPLLMHQRHLIRFYITACLSN